MPSIKKAALLCLFSAFALLGHAAELYVSKDLGDNANAGTKEAPLKNIEKAAQIAQIGDKICVAEGNYYGLRDKGFIIIKKPVEIYGGYSKDFAARDVLKHQTRIMPPASVNGTGSSNPLVELDVVAAPGERLIFDGIIFDKGDSNAYDPSRGKPRGVETGMLVLPPGVGQNGKATNVITAAKPLLGGKFLGGGELAIRNSVFGNGNNSAVRLGAHGEVNIANNVFVANAISACEIWGAKNQADAVKIDFSYNTMLFTWPRTASFGDGGQGFKVMTKADVVIRRNIIGLSAFAAIERARIDSPVAMEKGRKVRVNDNRFFLNKKADVILPGLGLFETIFAKDFADVDLFDEAVGNEELKDDKTLRKAVNKAYLEGFLDASYKESVDYDPNSFTNELRRVFGINQVATGQSEISMFANKYPLKDAIKLFGAVEGYGAQEIKY